MIEPDQQKRKQILLHFYTVAYEPILRHCSLCTPTENILSSPFLMFSGSIERNMRHEVGLKTLKSSRTQMFFRLGVLFHNIQRKTPELESLFNKVTGLQPCNFIKKRLQLRYFPLNIATFLRTALFIEHFRWLVLDPVSHLRLNFFYASN